jgi:hypothetical protein
VLGQGGATTRRIAGELPGVRGILTPVSSRFPSLLIGAVLALTASVGRADPLTAVRIDLEAPIDCAQPSTLYDAIRARTSRVVKVDDGHEEFVLRVQVAVDEVTGKVIGELRLGGQNGESDVRRVVGESCAEVVDALGLTAALALDPLVQATPSRRGGDGAGGVSSAQKPPAPLPRVTLLSSPRGGESPVVLRRPTNRFDVTLGAGLETTFILRGQTSWGPIVHGRLGLSERGWRPSVMFAFLHLRNDWSEHPSQVSSRASLLQLSLCPHRFQLGRVLAIRPSVIAVGGWMTATGQDVDVPETARRSLWQVGGELPVAISVVGPLGVEIAGGLVGSLVSRRFTLGTPPMVVGQTPRLARFGRFSVVAVF